MTESDKNASVEELLAQLFKEDASATTYVISTNLDEVIKENKQIIAEDSSNESDEVKNITTNTFDSQQEISDGDFEYAFRMKKDTFFDLQEEIKSRDLDSADNNLLLCLWMLGNVTPLSEIAAKLNVDCNVVEAVCQNYCKKIVKISNRYVRWPEKTELCAIEKDFRTEYKFPGVIGVLGCLHIAVHLPVDDNDINPDEYYNQNTENHTIVLQAVCDNNLLFRDLFVGYPGANTIESIFKASPLFKKLCEEDVFLQKTKRHLLGGTEHPQLPILLTPYTFTDSNKATESQIKFNGLHYCVMYTMEKTFHIVENRFQRMKCLDCFSPQFATLAAGAMCTLHNFTRLRNDFTCC